MHLRILSKFLVLLLFASIVSPAHAQQSEPQLQPTPAFRPGTGLLLDLGLGQGYESNVIGASQGGQFTQFDAKLGLHQTWEHSFWSVDFQPTARLYYNSSVADLVNEVVSTNDSWQVSRHWTLDLEGNYIHSTNPFVSSEAAASEVLPISGPVIIAPNSALASSLSPVTAFNGLAMLLYQIDKHTQLSFGGNYFGNRESNSTLPDANTHDFWMSYTKMVSRYQTVGLLYSAQFFNVSNPDQTVTAHSLLLSYGYKWKPGSQIGFFAGPQYSLLSANLFSANSPVASNGIKQDILDWSAGATLSIGITKQNFFQLMGGRRITDGGGVSGTVIQDGGELRFLRRFNNRVSTSVGFVYGKYEALGQLPLGTPNSWGLYNRTAFYLTPHSNITIEYDYSRSVPVSSPLARLFANHSASIEYHYFFDTLPSRR